MLWKEKETFVQSWHMLAESVLDTDGCPIGLLALVYCQLQHLLHDSCLFTYSTELKASNRELERGSCLFNRATNRFQTISCIQSFSWNIICMCLFCAVWCMCGVMCGVMYVCACACEKQRIASVASSPETNYVCNAGLGKCFLTACQYD